MELHFAVRLLIVCIALRYCSGSNAPALDES
jgi:hypothetical protein